MYISLNLCTTVFFAAKSQR